MSNLSGVWRVITSQPGLGVMLVRIDGCVEYVNDVFLEDYIPLRVEQIVGRYIPELFAEPVAIEIQSAIDRVVGTDTQFIRRVVFRGLETQVTYRWIADEAGDGQRVLITLQRGFREPSDLRGVEIAKAGFIDLGPLSALSDRELEVLELIGQGMRVKEVAASLCRSPKTVESHVGSICKKVGTGDRAVLMRIAREAGLGSGMVRRPRVNAIRAIDGTSGA